MSRADLDERAAQLRTRGEPFVRARVVLARRPTSAKAGDEAIVHADGSIEGFVGGTCAESTVRAQSLRLLRDPEPLLLRITPDAADDAGDADGGPAPAEPSGGTLTVHNPCLSGGALEIFLDPVVPPPLVLVHGDGPIAEAIARVTTAVGYRCAPADTVAGADAVVVASHGRDEAEVLCAALEAGVTYIGLVASRRRGAAVFDEIAADRPDLAAAVRERVDTPAGLDIGARTAGEIAISILASIVRSRPRRPARIIDAGADQSAEVAGTDGAAAAIDPVCGMTVAAVPASPHIEHDGRVVWFCGPGCLRAYRADPARYPES
jgi:xanthine dehydrogenase accessory factor